MQKLTRYLKAIIQSFYNPPLYREVLTQWQGIGAVYMLVLSAVMAVVLATIMAYGSVAFKRTELPHIAAQLPKMTITDGTIKVEGPQPAKVQGSKDMLLLYIDTTKSEEELRKVGDKVLMLVGKDFILIHSAQGFDKKTFENIKKMEISGDTILQGWPSPVAVFIGVWILGTLGQFMGLLFMAVAVVLCSYIVTAMMREEYEFDTRMRLSAIAMTPAILLSKILLLLANHNTAIWFDVLLSVLYFYVMVVLMRRPAVEK